MTYTGEEPPDATEGTESAKWPWAIAALVVAAAIAVVVIVLTGGSGDPVAGPTSGTPTPTDTASATETVTETATVTTTETPSATPTPTRTTTATDDDLLLRPDGLGAIEIGMSQADASATGTIGAIYAPGKEIPQCYIAKRTTDDHATIFFLDDEVVVIYLDRDEANPKVTTLEGISLESTPDEVTAAFPGINIGFPLYTGSVGKYRGSDNNLLIQTNGDDQDLRLQVITLESPKAECYS